MDADIVFVLVGTTHAGNIGAAARAMKTMGFDELRLVDCGAPLDEIARVRASGAVDILENARRYASLDEAIADCHWVVGTSARDRQIAVPVDDCRQLAARCAADAQSLTRAVAGTVDGPLRMALVFGRERSGLSNQEIDRCTHLARIPCNPQFGSLNLGSAVQVIACEWARAFGRVDTGTAVEPAAIRSRRDATVQSARSGAMQDFFEHLERVMVRSGFLDPQRPRFLMRRLRRYFQRNRPNENELNILRGILAATERFLPEPVDTSDSTASDDGVTEAGSLTPSDSRDTVSPRERDSCPAGESNRLP